ncbi:hat family dimerization [Fusarium beomiforme]|uniref:Hat family dimerization n=1 Tax=Fusarium beomiforme TaxID=44412 RepID=A0A9P5AA63_9HYPO|nr:hat family dimerization [Fusarium beomiforme]
MTLHNGARTAEADHKRRQAKNQSLSRQSFDLEDLARCCRSGTPHSEKRRAQSVDREHCYHCRGRPVSPRRARHHGRKRRDESEPQSQASQRKLQHAINAAIDAAAVELFFLRKEPGKWIGAKGTRVATAAVGAAKGQTSLYATPNGQISTSKGRLQKAHDLLIGSAYERAKPYDSIPPYRRQKTLQESLKKVLTSTLVNRAALSGDSAWLDYGREYSFYWNRASALSSASPFAKDLLQELLPLSGDTVRTWMKAEFEAEKELLKNELVSSPFKKHLSFDLWTSPTQYALLGINVHFIDTLSL